MYDPAHSTPIIKVTNINPGGVTVRCVILALFQLSDTFLGLMCTQKSLPVPSQYK